MAYDKTRKKKIYPFVRKKGDGDRLKTIYSHFRQHPVFIETDQNAFKISTESGEILQTESGEDLLIES